MFMRTVSTLMFAAMLGAAQADPVCRSSDFDVWIDVSGSMMLPQENAAARDGRDGSLPKIARAKAFLKKVAAENRGEAETGIFTVAPFTVRQEPARLSATEYARVLDEEVLDSLESVGRMTWLGERAKRQLAREKHLVLVTDGAFSLWKEAEKVPVKEAFDAFRANGGRLTVLSLAGNEEENVRLYGIFGEHAVVDLDDVLLDEQQTSRLVEKILDRRCAPVAMPVMELRGIHFDFGKATLTRKSDRILDEALDVVRKQSPDRKLEITGWTDSVGSDACNRRLYRARAGTVKDYFAARGIDQARMTVRGEGKSFRYDNGTAHGRRMNRRVDIRFMDE